MKIKEVAHKGNCWMTDQILSAGAERNTKRAVGRNNMLTVRNNKLTSTAPSGNLDIIDPDFRLYIFVDKHSASLFWRLLLVRLILS